MEQAEIPQLQIPRENARQKLEARCHLGRALFGKYMIESVSDTDGVYKTAMIKSDFRLWDASNMTTDYFADEYSSVNAVDIKKILEASSAIEEDERKRVYILPGNISSANCARR